MLNPNDIFPDIFLLQYAPHMNAQCTYKWVYPPETTKLVCKYKTSEI